MVPFSNHSFTGELIRPMTAEDENFQNLLQQCTSVTDVLKLLEIPSERVTGYSASAALQRMAELQRMNKDWDDLPSFIRTAVMNELLVRLNSHQVSMMSDCARWLFLNVHDVTDEQLAAIVGAYIHFQVSDVNLMTSLERYVPAKGSKLDTTLLGLVQELCMLQCRLGDTLDKLLGSDVVRLRSFAPDTIHSIGAARV
nr:hypothetical protein BaRGS_026622 [Batillaria attramentaria]